MLTGQIRNQIDQIWNAFHSGGVSNPLSVIEQLTFLIFIKRLDDLQLTMETRAETLGEPITNHMFHGTELERPAVAPPPSVNRKTICLPNSSIFS